jgi:hypothetical protein
MDLHVGAGDLIFGWNVAGAKERFYLWPMGANSHRYRGLQGTLGRWGKGATCGFLEVWLDFGGSSTQKTRSPQRESLLGELGLSGGAVLEERPVCNAVDNHVSLGELIVSGDMSDLHESLKADILLIRACIFQHLIGKIGNSMACAGINNLYFGWAVGSA